jgi:RNA polymerase sigma-70 factor, ECF subfamily
MSSSAAALLPDWVVEPRPRLLVCPPPPATPPAPAAAPEALRATLVSMLPALRRRALRWCRTASEAEDLAHDTLLRALPLMNDFGSEQHLRAWLYTVQRNLLISRRRRQRSELRARARLEGAKAGGFSLEAAPAPFLTPSLERALAALPQSFAKVLRLVDLEEHSYGEASQALGIPVGTVMSRLFRARQRLAEALQPIP